MKAVFYKPPVSNGTRSSPEKPGTPQFAFLADCITTRRQGIGIATEESTPCLQFTHTGDWSGPAC